MAGLNIAPFRSNGRMDEKEMKRLQSYLNQMTEQLRFALATISLEDITDAIDGSIITPGSIRDDRLYSRFVLADTAHATYATIETLVADYIKAEDIEATYATIGSLTAATAEIGNLTAEVANIGSVLAGNVGTGSLQTLVINSVNASIANATIKSAMIDSINTDEVTIASGSGRMQIADNTIQISDDGRVRVQIGKDASDDYSLYVWDVDGNLMFDASGLHEGGIKNPIIRDSMVAEDAAINASKVYVDLDVEDGSLDILFSDASDAIGSLNTSMNLINGRMSLLISETEAEKIEDGATLYSKYAALVVSLDGLTSTVANQETVLADSIKSMQTRMSKVEQTADSVTTSFHSVDAYINGDGDRVGVSNYIKESLSGMEIGLSNSSVYSRFDNKSLAFIVRGQDSKPAMSLEVDEETYESVVKTRNAEIVEDLRFMREDSLTGGFVFTPRANGNLSLKKV